MYINKDRHTTSIFNVHHMQIIHQFVCINTCIIIRIRLITATLVLIMIQDPIQHNKSVRNISDRK